MSAYDSKKALLSNLIDYAGTFPPAALPFEKAIQEAMTFRKTLHYPWLFSKFALPMELLKKLNSRILFQQGGDGSPLPVAALGSSFPDADSEADFARVVEWDLREIGRLNERGFGASYCHWVVSYDTKIPVGLLAGEAVKLENFLDIALDRMQAHTSTPLAVNFEITLTAKFSENLKVVGECIQDWFSENSETPIQAGLKIRTGGNAAPSAEQLAEFIAFCVQYGLRFKATQGLHHPITHKGEFGFVNVFSALTLAYALGTETFGTKLIADCLNCTAADKFQFEPQEFSWDGFEIDLDTIEAARRKHGGCFGSCSMAEPDTFLFQEIK